jgi:hypothetical protein
MNKINQYLLTRYPLIWNTKVVWVLLANCIIHFLFFAAGFASLSLETIRDFSSVWSVGGGTLFTFSVLCSLLVIIIWLVFFLRNNAFKNFYRIDKWHLAKEFAIMLVIIFTSINFFGSYNFGVRLRARSITSQEELVKELNAVNKAMAFVPESRDEFFILNNCEGRKGRTSTYSVQVDTTTVPSAQDTVTLKIWKALRIPGAISYKHYCTRFFDAYFYKGLTEREALADQRNKWIETHNADSIRNSINDLIGICHRYGIGLQLNSDALSQAVFAKPYNNIDSLIPGDHFRQDGSGNTIENTYYLSAYGLTSVFDFLDECHSSPSAARDRRSVLNVECYLALCASIFLLCYRRFNRKVFLISVVGTIVWAILIGLMVASAGGKDTFPTICIALCLFFLLIALVNLKSGSGKTTTGILLTWHSFLVPFIILFIMMLMSDYYSDQSYKLTFTGNEELAPKLYPISYWVSSHGYLISQLNLLLMVVYIGFLFNKFARLWHEQPHE